MTLRTRRITPMLALAALVACAAPAAQAQFAIGANFTGMSWGSYSDHYIPPDTMGAIGPNHFAEALNGQFTIYDRTGTALSRQSLNQFWTTAGVTPTSFSFDPRILYDKASQRWFMASADNGGVANGHFLLAVSSSSDPTGAWTAFGIESDPVDTSHWVDFPTLGMNSAGVYLAGNMFSTDPNLVGDRTAIVAVNKADLIGGTLNYQLFPDLSPYQTGFSAQPVVDLDGGATPERLYSAWDPTWKGSSSLIKRTDVVRDAGDPAQGAHLDLGPSFIGAVASDDPVSAHQPGGPNTIEAGDLRFRSNVILVGGNVWAVHGVLGPSGHDALRWYRIDPTTNLVLETGLIGDATHDYYEGSIAVDDAGYVVIGYTRSGDDEYASSYVSTGRFDGTATTLGAPMLLKAGLSSYSHPDSHNRNRWGDYSATTVDPTDPFRFWTIQEYANASGDWSTQITELYVPQGSTRGGGNNVPVSGAHTTLIGAGLAILGWIRRRRLA